MIYLHLFLGFLRVGCFSFGGAYGAIPLIRDVVLSYGWISEEMLTYMIAVSESTPGPIMINLATYVGSHQGGLPGAILATGAYMTVNHAMADMRAAILTVLLAAVLLCGRRILKKKLSPVLFIVLSACMGMLAYGL